MKLSVVITTYNRLSTLTRAVESVLGQEGVEFELVIANDGSADDTRAYLDSITDKRVTVIHRENGGLSAARNSGIAAASGQWIGFLDDDDVALPGWLATMAHLIDDGVGAVTCGAVYVTPDGQHVSTRLPRPMGEMFMNQIANKQAGTFILPTELARSIGGFDERITSSHHNEFWLRLIPELLARGLRVRTTNDVLVQLEKRPAADRPMSSPRALYNGVRLLVSKHQASLARDPRHRADLYGVLGVSAARLEHWPEARSALLTSARAQPASVRRWARLAVSTFPPVARRLWHTADFRSEE